MMNAWDCAYLASMPLVAPLIAYRRLTKGKYRQSLPAMLGRNLPAPLPKPATERLWIHSVSVGETVAAGAVYTRLKKMRPDWEYLHTTTTETGFEQSKRSLSDANYRSFAPLDFSSVVGKFLDVYKPSAYLFFETEIWPNTLSACAERKTPIILVNGKISDRSARRYAAVRGLFQPALRNLKIALMQTEDDAERIQWIAGKSLKVAVTGNVKFDSLPEPLSDAEKEALRLRYSLAPDDFVIIAGSTHAGEEQSILTAYRQIQSQIPNARLIIVPRHPERFNEVEKTITGAGYHPHRSSSRDFARKDAVILVDEMGVLARLFGMASVALVGGSWAKIGGHNLLEPAAHGVPVIHGPYMHAQKDIMRIMRSREASLEIASVDIAKTIVRLYANQDLRRQLSEKALLAAQENRGAAQRAVDIILDQLSVRPS